MPFHAPRVSVVVPTKDHPDDLRRLLESLASQTRQPNQVIVVDGGAATVESIVRGTWPFPTEYVRVDPPGLARQQNAGISRADAQAALVALVDDDIVFEGDAFERMLAFWDKASLVIGGASFNLVNNTDPPRYVWLKGLFGLDAARRGILLPSGYQTKIGAVASTTEVEWLYGGATVWRREVLDAHVFDEWFEGSSHLYELEFCLRVGSQWRMMVVADARAREVSGNRVWNDTPLGRWQILNRLYIVRKYDGQRGLSVTRCWVALIGQFAWNLLRAVVERNPRYLSRAYGNCLGFRDALQN